MSRTDVALGTALAVAGLAALLNLTGCRTLTLDAPREIRIRCHHAPPAHWRMLVDGTERVKLTFPEKIHEALPCPPPPTP